MIPNPRVVQWRSLLDPTQHDEVSVTLHPSGLTAQGRQTCSTYRAEWQLEVGDEWITRSLMVTVTGQGWGRSIRLARATDTGHWSAECTMTGPQPTDMPPPGIVNPDVLDGALDCDLGRCPLTNTMPIRRLGLMTGQVARTPLTMAWVDMPSLNVIASDQYYSSIDAQHVRYASGTRKVDVVLTVDEDGIVVDYPDLAQRVPART